MRVGELAVRLGMDFSQYNRDESEAKRRVGKLGNTLSGILKGAFSITLGMGLFQGIEAGTGAIKDLLVTAAQTETINVAMEAVARSTGTSTEALQQQKKAVMDLGIAEQEATKMLTRFMQAQLDVSQTSRLARVAQDAAVIAGENSSVAAAQITEAIAKQRPELLNAYGMTKNLNDIYADYAVRAGIVVTTTDKYGKQVRHLTRNLTDAEKKQAMLNYILKEGEKVAGSYEAAMGTVGKKLGSLERLTLPKKLSQELKTALAGPLLLPAFNVLVDNIIAAMERGKKWVEENKDTLKDWGKSLAGIIQMVWKVISGFINFFINNWKWISVVVFASLKAFLVFATVKLAIAGAAKAVRAFNLVTRIMRGTAVATSGSLGFLSTVVAAYRKQLLLASAQGKIAVGVFTRLRLVFQSLWTALGPIGWIVLGLSLLVEAGIYVYQNWDKVKYYGLQAWGALKVGIGYYVYAIIGFYKLLLGWLPAVGSALSGAQQQIMQAVEREKGIMAKRKSAYAKSTEPVDQMKDDLDNLAGSINKSADAFDEQADSLEDAADAAEDNLQSFDEVYQITEDGSKALKDITANLNDLPEGFGVGGSTGGDGDVDIPSHDWGIGNVSPIAPPTIPPPTIPPPILPPGWDAAREKIEAFRRILARPWPVLAPVPVPSLAPDWETVKEWLERLRERLLQPWPVPNPVPAPSLLPDWETARGWLEGFRERLQRPWPVPQPILAPALPGWEAIRQWLESFRQRIAEAMPAPDFEPVKNGLQNALQWMFQMWADHKVAILIIAGAIVVGIIACFAGIPASAMAVISPLLPAIGAFLLRIPMLVRQIITRVPVLFQQIFARLPGIVQQVFVRLPTLARQAVTGIANWFTRLPSMIGNAIKSVPSIISRNLKLPGMPKPAISVPGAAAGGVFMKPSVIGIAEKEPEAAIPLSRLNEFAGGGGGEVHLHVGTLVADDRGLKELERRLQHVRLSEATRKGGKL